MVGTDQVGYGTVRFGQSDKFGRTTVLLNISKDNNQINKDYFNHLNYLFDQNSLAFNSKESLLLFKFKV